MYKGVVKVTYDRGFAVQTKSLLLESTTTATETVAQLFHGLGLRGTPMDYALEERNVRTGGMQSEDMYMYIVYELPKVMMLHAVVHVLLYSWKCQYFISCHNMAIHQKKKVVTCIRVQQKLLTSVSSSSVIIHAMKCNNL